MDQKLPRNHRLKSSERISELYRKGDRLKQSFLLIYYLENGEGHHRMAAAVPKRKVPSAVKRNAIKRKIRELYRLNKSLLPNTDQGKDFLILYLGSEIPEYQKLERAYQKLWEKWENSESV